ncbi:MAG: surface antigen [Gemmatimonadetes bacterium]|nr:surface antigen [Gemmatimonadota bacterium]
MRFRFGGVPVQPFVVAALALLSALTALTALPAVAHAQDVACDDGRKEVRVLSFEGNRTFTDDDLSARVLTTPSSFAKRYLRVFGTPRCYPSVGLGPDVRALTQFYRNNGFYNTKVDTLVQAVGPNAVAVTFRIDEGQPIVLDSLTITGLDSVPQRDEVLRNLQLKVGGRFSFLSMFADIDSIVGRLRNFGYAHAAVYPASSVQLQEHRATVTLDVQPGARARINEIAVRSVGVNGGPPEIDSAVVLRLLGFRTGDWYSDRALVEAQRNLYQLGAYRHVGIALDTTWQHGDTLADVALDLREDYMRQIDQEEGWATLDCGRASAQYTDKNFLKNAHHLELTGRASKLGWGNPTNWRFTRQNLCYRRYLDNDSIASSTVNYYVGATLREPSLFGTHWVPSYSLYSERRGEYEAYLRRTDIGGEASATRTIALGMPLRLAYTLELGQTRGQPTTLCLIFSRCTQPQQDEIQRRLRSAIASVALRRTRTDNPVDPTSGTSVAGELRLSEPWLGSDTALKFIKGTFDGSWFYPLPSRAVLATRLRLGAVGGTKLPTPEERLYAGGATSVRGFQQNELGSVVYLLNSDAVAIKAIDDTTFEYTVIDGKRAQRTVPVGGNQLIVANVELRLRDPFFPELLQYALFTDAGEVWTRQPGVKNLGFTRLAVTPGIGVRISSPVGPINVNAGYNPYGSPAAQAYFPEGSAPNAPLICVSPTGSAPILVHKDPSTGALVQENTGCPATFRQPQSSNFFKKLTLTISIGNSF